MKIIIIELPPEQEIFKVRGFSAQIAEAFGLINIAPPKLEKKKDFQPLYAEIETKFLPKVFDIIKLSRDGGDKKYYVSEITLTYQTYYDYEIKVFDALLYDALHSQVDDYFDRRKYELIQLRDLLAGDARFNPPKMRISPDQAIKELVKIATKPDFDYEEERARLELEYQLYESPETYSPKHEPPFDISKYATTQTGFTYFVNGEERYLEPNKPESKPLPFWRRFLNLYK